MRAFVFGICLLSVPLLLPVPQAVSAPGLLERLVSGEKKTQQTTGANSLIPAPEVYFSPRGGCTEAVVRELNAARQTVLVQAYSFTSAPIASALVAASRRGVRVEAVLDKSNKTGKYSEADFLLNGRIPTYIDDKHAIAHNKVMIIDGETVLTGSFNFTKAAEESNAENLLILRSTQLAGLYSNSFLEHREHSPPYTGR
jgi:phosphatidylserine/phosphatidylglycerophosphate/cardiolipin synthase-like enzyme